MVYPAHGVGKVDRIGTEVIAGHRLNLIQVSFAENRMTLRIPAAQARVAGLRKLATPEAVAQALATLRGRPRVSRLMWAKRAQEYLAKINSGDLHALAEVVRDLQAAGDGSGSSFSQRNLFELAVDRLAAEFAVVSGPAARPRRSTGSARRWSTPCGRRRISPTGSRPPPEPGRLCQSRPAACLAQSWRGVAGDPFGRLSLANRGRNAYLPTTALFGLGGLSRLATQSHPVLPNVKSISIRDVRVAGLHGVGYDVARNGQVVQRSEGIWLHSAG